MILLRLITQKSRVHAIAALLFCCFLMPGHAATCTAVASANWTVSTTWSCGHEPGCNDVIIIPSGYTVTINNSISLTGGGCANTSITIGGALFMSGNASQLNLVATATINILPGGKLLTDITNNSQKIFIGTGPAEWDSMDGNLTGPWIITNGVSTGTLPIELLGFTATCGEKDVAIGWTTATEIHNDYFIVEKSTDALTWELLAKIKSAGSGPVLRYYTCTDDAPAHNQTMYYRLRQINLDGTSKQYPMIDALCTGPALKSGMILFPNPANDKLSVTVTGNSGNAAASIVCLNTLGEVVFEEPIVINADASSFTLPAGMPDGIYSIFVSSPGLSIPPQRLVVARAK